MRDIMQNIKNLSAKDRQDLITLLVFTYGSEMSKANNYTFWPSKLESEASDNLKELLKAEGKYPKQPDHSSSWWEK